MDCLQTLLNNPQFTNSLDFSPYRVFTTAQCLVQVCSEWMSSDVAWKVQVGIYLHGLEQRCLSLACSEQTELPEGACVLGVILSSDKTHVTNQSGGKVSHPLLMSLANIHAEVQAKASLHAFVPIVFLFITEFIHNDQQMQGILRDHLYHQCLDIVMNPLKIAACIGIMVSDPLGKNWYCFTPLIIVDMPEACLIACV